MKKYIKINSFWFLIVLACLSACGNKANRLFEVGERLSHDLVYKSEGYLMTSSASIEAMFTTSINGLNYTFCKNQEGSISYISTNDENFTTKEGYRVGMSFAEITKSTGRKPNLEPGWAYVLPLENGWYAAFDLSQDLQSISADSTVKWFYRR